MFSHSLGQKVPLPILELSKHGKRGIDFYFITQDPTLVHNTPRKLCETHYHVIRAFGSQNAMVHKFNRMQTDPEKVKGKAEKIPWRYPPEAFGKKDKAGNYITRPWYKSADVHNIQRKVPLKVWAIPGVAAVAGLAIWAAFHMFGGVLDKAKGGAPGSLDVPMAAASSSGAMGAPGTYPPRGAAPMTTAQYVDARTPRLPDLAYTAPVYDRVTEPVEAPFPAACIHQGDKCKCYSQQATVLAVSNSVCLMIVEKGFFLDWKKPGGNVAPPPQQYALSQQAVAGQVVPSAVSAPPVRVAQQEPLTLQKGNPQPGSTLADVVATYR